MRIFYVITKSEVGGAQMHVFQLIQYFRSLGNDVALMSYPGGWLEKQAREAGAAFYPNTHLSNSLNPLYDIRASLILRRALKDFSPDLVSCHSSKTGWVGRMTIRNRIPTIFTAHGWGFTKGVPLWRRALIVATERIASRFCARIICVSEYDRQLALKHRIAPAKKLTMIHNGGEIRSLCSREERERIRIIFVGRLAPQKQPLLLLRAFSELPLSLRKQVEVFIIGEGPQRQELLEFVETHNLQENVRRVEEQNHEQVMRYLKQSDIFVLPSKWEGFPMTILEAMSVGLPIVASNVGGVSEVVDETCGILFKKGDAQELTHALQTLIEDPAKRVKLGLAGRERLAKEFTLERMMNSTQSVYREAADARRK